MNPRTAEHRILKIREGASYDSLRYRALSVYSEGQGSVPGISTKLVPTETHDNKRDLVDEIVWKMPYKVGTTRCAGVSPTLESDGEVARSGKYAAFITVINMSKIATDETGNRASSQEVMPVDELERLTSMIVQKAAIRFALN